MQTQFSAHRPVVMGTDWMITSDHPLAAQAGATVLEAGGNAVDAAVAANLVMAVVRPHMCGLGGDLFALIYMAREKKLEALDASGRAPYAATLDVYREKGYTSLPETGILTATVPGAIAGWQAALEKHGTKRLDQLLPKAVKYAANGFPVYSELRSALQDRRKFLEQSPAAAETLFKSGRLPDVGELLVQPRLAESLKMLADKGPDAFYHGPLGDALIAFSAASGGLFSQRDLLDHFVTWHEPLKTTYKGYEICTQPPSSQGIALLMQANMLENFDLAETGGFGRTELVHLMVEAKKLAFADRNRYVCDPAFHPVPVEQLLDKNYAKKQIERINPAAASHSVAPTDFTGGSDTIYLAVVDGNGNAVSMIQSLFEFFGSCTMVPGTGIILHNRGRGFTLDPHHVNRLEPHKRPYHTLHPAMILKDGRPYIVLGTPGADGQTQTVIQLITNMLDFKANVQEAVEAPRWRSNPDGILQIEGRFPPETIAELKAKGHRLEVLSDWHQVMGSAQAILIDTDHGILMGGADPRRQAYAIGS
ncbi:MAG: gamma-glutamyltransferase [Desulfobacterales bacterium]|nr:MAG: gamma-glutamyltransferase [Desulfobacterales bacterium]